MGLSEPPITHRFTTDCMHTPWMALDWALGIQKGARGIWRVGRRFARVEFPWDDPSPPLKILLVDRPLRARTEAHFDSGGRRYRRPSAHVRGASALLRGV